MAVKNRADADKMVAALEATKYDQWYLALLCAAMEDTDTIEDAINVADATFAAHPRDTSKTSHDDAEAIFASRE